MNICMYTCIVFRVYIHLACTGNNIAFPNAPFSFFAILPFESNTNKMNLIKLIIFWI